MGIFPTEIQTEMPIGDLTCLFICDAGQYRSPQSATNYYLVTQKTGYYLEGGLVFIEDRKLQETIDILTSIPLLIVWKQFAFSDVHAQRVIGIQEELIAMQIKRGNHVHVHQQSREPVSRSEIEKILQDFS